MSRGQRQRTPAQFPNMKHRAAGRLLKKRAKCLQLRDIGIRFRVDFQPMIDALNTVGAASRNSTIFIGPSPEPGTIDVITTPTPYTINADGATNWTDISAYVSQSGLQLSDPKWVQP